VEGRQTDPIEALVADLELGLSSARLAARAEDPWFAACNRAKARKAYEAVMRMMDRVEADLRDHADVLSQLEQLRRAVQAA
jgi:hypothetical protein